MWQMTSSLVCFRIVCQLSISSFSWQTSLMWGSSGSVTMTITSREERLQRSPGPSLSGDSDHINYAKVVWLCNKEPGISFQINYAKVVILGAMGVGKTALIKVGKIRKIMNHQSSSPSYFLEIHVQRVRSPSRSYGVQIRLLPESGLWLLNCRGKR